MTPRAFLAVVFLAPALPAQHWVQLDGPIRPGNQAAFDTGRNRLVMLGEEGETWEFDASTRLHRANLGPAGTPKRRLRGAMAAHPDHGLTLLFGGSTTGSGFGPHLADTWLWNGSGWAPIVDRPTPPARIDAVMAFDSWRNRFVMYGGQGDSGLRYDTWERDEKSWIAVQTENVPRVSRGRMVFDSTRGVSVLVSSPGILGQPMLVYEYDGSDWTQRLTSGSWPLTRSSMSVAYDEGRQVTVMIGGTYFGEEIWEWDGNAWTLVHTLPAPWRIDAPAYYDPTLSAIVVVGGKSGTPPIEHTDAYTWDGTTFAQLRPDHSPQVRYDEVFFADTVRKTLIMSGGPPNRSWNDTWEWDGIRWNQLQPRSQVPVRGNTSSTFDTVRGLGLVFGGFNAGNQLGDLWGWDGTDWSQLSAGGGPTPRSGAGMAFDLARGVAIVFGGGVGPLFQAGMLRNDTWEWDGDSWTERTSAVAPRPRERPAMAYDMRRGVTVLFGGRVGLTASDQLDDTWEWNGFEWQQINPVQSPPPLLSPTLTYDPQRERLVLVGVNVASPTFLLEVWEYDGDSWMAIDRDTPTVNGGTSTAWDEVRQQITMYDGSTVRAWTNQPATAQAYGAGCGSLPLAMLRTRPRLGTPQFGFEARVAPGQPTLFAIGVAPASTPLTGGCNLLVAPILWAAGVADSFGTAHVVLPLARDPVFRGASLFAQAGVIDSISPLAVGLSVGMHVILGE